LQGRSTVAPGADARRSSDDVPGSRQPARFLKIHRRLPGLNI
jgi:hypothetical protein